MPATSSVPIGWTYRPDRFERWVPQVQWRRGPKGNQGRNLLREELQLPSTPLVLAPIAFRDVQDWARHGLLRPLDDALAPHARKRLAPAALRFATIGKTLYALPDDLTPYALAVREDLLRERGLAPPETWADWTRLLARVRKETDTTPVAMQRMAGQSGLVFLLALLASNGLDPLSDRAQILEHAQAACEAFHWLREISNAGHWDPLGASGMAGADPHAQLRSGQVLFFLGWAGPLGQWPAEEQARLGLLAIPRGPSATCPAATLVHGHGWCVPAHSTHPQWGLRALSEWSLPERLIASEVSGGYAFSAWRAYWSAPEVLAPRPLYRYASEMLERAPGVLPDHTGEGIRRLANSMRQALREGLSDRAWWARFADEESTAAGGRVRSQAVRRALAFIDENFARIQGVREIARAARSSPHHFQRLFKAEVGETCGAYLKRRRLEQANRLLADPALSVKEIAHRVGFGSASSFAHVYKRYWKRSPTQARDSLRR